jgi:hypothetical protein
MNAPCAPPPTARPSLSVTVRLLDTFMKSRIITWLAWIIVTVILCAGSFWYGRTTDPQRRYDATALAEDTAILTLLREGDSTNAIPRMESFLDMGTYHAMRAWPSVRGRDREILGSILLKVARYREQFPRPMDTTNGLADVQRQVDNFLQDIKEHPVSIGPVVTASCSVTNR